MFRLDYFVRDERLENGVIVPRVYAVFNGKYDLNFADSKRAVSEFRKVSKKEAAKLLNDLNGVLADDEEAMKIWRLARRNLRTALILYPSPKGAFDETPKFWYSRLDFVEDISLYFREWLRYYPSLSKVDSPIGSNWSESSRGTNAFRAALEWYNGVRLREQVERAKK